MGRVDWYFGLIAQWIEHPPSKRAVAGSSPAQSVFPQGFYEDPLRRASYYCTTL